jgi:hypothetical protein
MLFGNRARIAIESEIDISDTTWCFGRACIWANGQQIGDYSQTMILTVAATFFVDFLTHTGDRHDPVLASFPSDLLVSTLYAALFGDDELLSLHELARNGKRFQKFCVCPGGGESFDGVLAFFVEGQRSSRFVWLNFECQNADEIELEQGEFEGYLRAFADWINDGCGSDRSPADP